MLPCQCCIVLRHTANHEHTRRAHIASLISVHVGIGQRCRALDVESPTPLPTMRKRNVSAALDESSRNVQKASTPYQLD
eukprot:scaffold26994_cov83-Phaeocystis_antarctica.AAC.2